MTSIESKTVLTRLFRMKLIKSGIDESKMKGLVDDYLKRTLVEGLSADKIQQAHANVRKELAQTQMSWNVFCKAMRILGEKDVEITVGNDHARSSFD